MFRLRESAIESLSTRKKGLQFKRVAETLVKPIIPKGSQRIMKCNWRVTDIYSITIRNCFESPHYRLDVHVNECIFPETSTKRGK